MEIVRLIWFRLRALLQRDAVNVEFDDELRFHIERETDANITRGMNAQDARRVALAEFGGVERFKEDLRDERGVRWLDEIGGDVKHGFRLLRKNKLFSGAVIGTLALSIGATTTIFAIVNGVLLRKPAYFQPDRVFSVSQTRKVGGDSRVIGQYNYETWSESARTISGVALFSGNSKGTMTGVNETVELTGAQSTASYFNVLGATPTLGRLYTKADESTTSERVIVLSSALWKGRFGGDSSIIGRSITINDVPRTVIGVMTASFDTPNGAEFWSPIRLANNPNAEFLFNAIVRVKDGFTADAVQRELQALTVRRDSLRTEQQRGAHIIVMSTHDRQFGSIRKPLALMFGAVVALLLIACINVANLTLARSAERWREFAVRLALGAGRWRLARQLFVESAILAVIGGAIGCAVPFVLVGAFVKLGPDFVAGVHDIHVDGTVLAFAAITTTIAALVFGLAPALTGASSGASAKLAGGARSGTSRSHGIVRSTLVILEITTALTLLTGAGLLTKSFARALSINPGFRPQHVYGVYVNLPRTRYDSAAKSHNFYQELESRVSSTPGVEMVALTDGLPLKGFVNSVMVKNIPDDGAQWEYFEARVSGSFANTMGLHLIEGRFINDSDRKGTEPVAMVSKSFAHQFHPNGSAIGQALRTTLSGEKDSAHPVIVGVIDDTPQINIEEQAKPQVFLASAQMNDWPSYLVVRGPIDREALNTAVKRFVKEIDPKQPLVEFFTMSDVLAKSYAPRRFNSVLINAFAGLALVLAVIGLYGLMAHAVASRTRELGIRIALGATSDNVMRLVLRHGMLLTLVGIACGVAMSFALARTLSGLLYDVTTHDPFVFAAAPVTLAIIAFVACYVPARRATSVNPMIALRQE